MKNKISDILFKLFSFHYRAVIFKRLLLDNKWFLIRFKELTEKRSWRFLDSNSNQNNILNYITSRNMRKTLTPSSLKDIKDSFQQINKTSNFNVKDIFQVISANWQQSKPLFPLQSSSNFLKFYTNSGILKNLISQQSESTPEPKPEDPDSWGGPENFKLILFLKEDFNEVIQKYPFLILFFYAYWCPHCLRLKKPYGIAAKKAKEANVPVQFAAFDVTLSPETADEKGVVGIPTIKYYKKGKFVQTYRGKRTPEDLFEFVKNPPPILEAKESEDNV